MMYEKHHFTTTDNQHYYNNSRSEHVDLSELQVLHTGIDTLKYYFQCTITDFLVTRLQNHINNKPDSLIQFGHYDFSLRKGGSKTGYQFILKNLDIGLVILVKQFHAENTDKTTHIKIELSPELIIHHSGNDLELDTFIQSIASEFAYNPVMVDIATHFCIDFRGWIPPRDFFEHLSTRSKFTSKYTAVSEYDLSSNTAIYGDIESFTFGSASTIQMCLYNKSNQVEAINKRAYWYTVWQGEYTDVYRLEFRISHTVLRQFERGSINKNDGSNVTINSLVTLRPKLQGLFEYCLDNFCYRFSSSYIHPLWTHFRNNVSFSETNHKVLWKRLYKSTEYDTRRAVGMAMGHIITLQYAKNTKTTIENVLFILRNTIPSDALRSYFKALDSFDLDCKLTDKISRKLDSLRIDGRFKPAILGAA